MTAAPASPLPIVALRPACESDAEKLLSWRNDPFIVARTSSGRAVARDEHMAWFRDSLAMPDRRLIWIVERAAQPIGAVRADRAEPDTAVISVHLIESEIGHGFGVEAIRIGCAEAFRHWRIGQIVACVRDDNPPSQRAFLRAGFEESTTSACPAAHRTFRLAR